MFGKVSDDSFTHIFDLSLDSEDSRLGFQSSYGNNHKQMAGNGTSNSSSPMSSRRDFSSSPSTPSSSSSLPLEAAFSQFAASFSTLLADKESAASAAISLDKKISELERLRNKINNSDSHSSASSTTSSSSNGSTSTSSAASKVNTSRYKTELCRPFSEHGTCKYGEKCQFAHGQAELRSVSRHPKYKTDLCRTYHSVGFCPYGPRCHFVHNLDEVTNEPSTNQGSQQQGQQQQQQQKQQQQQPSSFSPSSNKIIGSGRIISANKLPEDQQQKIRPLPMFDTARNNNNQNNQSQRVNNLFPQNPSGWNPLHSINLNVNEDNNQKARLPVFSTLSK